MARVNIALRRVRDLALLIGIAFASAMRAQPVDTVTQPLVSFEPVDSATLSELGLVTIRTSSGACSGAMLNSSWALTAHHCVINATPAATKVIPANDASNPRSVSKIVDLVSMGQLDLALVQVTTSIPQLSSLPEITARPNAQLGGVVVETFGRGIFQLAGVVNGAWQPSQSDGMYRRGVFPVTHAMSGSIELSFGPGTAIAGGDSGGPSYIKIWKDPNNHALGTYREIVGVASHCDVVRPESHRNTAGWTWVTRVLKCRLATPGPIRAHIAAVIAEGSPTSGEGGGVFPPPNTAPPSVGRNRALYVASLDRPLVPAAPVERDKPLLFTQCQPEPVAVFPPPGCPHESGYDVWRYDGQRKSFRHVPTGWCLAPATLADGAVLVLRDCGVVDLSYYRWEILPVSSGSDRWTIRNQQTQLCATAEYPPRALLQPVRGIPARLVARPCNGSNAQIFDTVDADHARRTGPG